MSSDVPGLRRQPSERLEKQQPARLGQHISGVLLGISWHILWVITAHHSTFGTFLILFLSLLRPVMAWTLWFPVVPYSSLRFLVAFRMPCLCAPTSLDPCHTFIPNKPWHSPELFPWRFQEKHLKCAKCMKVSWKHKNSACKAQTSKRETMDSTSLRYRMPSRSGEFQERWFGPIYGLVQHMPGKHKQANQIGRTILILLTSLS